MRNRFEEKVAARLGSQYAYEATKLRYVVEHTYTPDFVDFANKRIVESKGFFSPQDRKKMKAVVRQNPDWSVTIIFQNPDARISKTSKTTYAGWCIKNGIAWERV